MSFSTITKGVYRLLAGTILAMLLLVALALPVSAAGVSTGQGVMPASSHTRVVPTTFNRHCRWVYGIKHGRRYRFKVCR